VNGRPLTVQRYRRVGEIRACQVLFISRSEADRLEQILTSLRGRGILTIGDTDDFAARGGMIRLATEKNKVRMRINLDAVKAANLTISSKLLRVAEIQH
jgi:YfiR/HmsC-like